MQTTIEPGAKASLSANENETHHQEERVFLGIIGDLVEQWGFKRHLGRIWALLYLRNEPLNPSQIQEELSLSAGAVNALLSELQTWGAIKRIRIPGDRNYYFEPQTAIWKSLSNVFRSRELRILEEATLNLEDLKDAISKGSDPELAKDRLEKIKHIESVLQTGLTLAKLLINQPPERLEKVSKLISHLRRL